MNFFKIVLLALAVVISADSWILAQQERPERMRRADSPGRPPADVVSAGRGNSTAGSGLGRGPAVSATATSVAGIPAGSRIRAGTPGTSVPLQTYTPQYQFNYGVYYRTRYYYSKLGSAYPFLDVYSSLWRYVQGDSPLTPGSVRLGLQDAYISSQSLVELTGELRGLVTRYEGGEISKDEFAARVEATTDRIRDRAKDVRKDYFLDYLDLRKNQNAESVREVSTVADLHHLIDRMETQARLMESGLSGFYSEDRSRVVHINDLQQPSFDSISKGIDKLARAIEKSSTRM